MAVRFRRFGAALGVLAATLLLGSLAQPAQAASVAATPTHTVGFSDEVLAMASSGDTIYVGGLFTSTVDGSTRATGRSYLAAVDARTGALLSWAPTVNGPVTAIAVSGSNVYLGGQFTEVNGVARRHVAEVSTAGTLNQSFVHTIGTAPMQLAIGNGRLYAVGDFGSVDNRPWSRAAAFSLTTGAQDTAFKPVADDTVDTVAVGGSRVYLGGVFHRINGSAAHPRMAAVSATTGATVDSFAGGSPVIVHHIAVGSGAVYAALGGAGGRLAAYTMSGQASWSLTTDGDVADLAVLGGAIYGGGHFDNACTTSRVATVHGTCLDGHVPRGKLFAVDPSGHLLNWAPQANSVRGVAILAGNAARGTLAAGGAFTTFGGGTTTQQRFALFHQA